MDARLVGALVLSVTLAALGGLVVAKNPRGRINRFFGLAVISIIGWVLSISFALTVRSEVAALISGRLAFFFASGMPFWLLAVFHSVHVPQVSSSSRGIWIAATAWITFASLSLSPAVVQGIQHTAGRTNFIYGVLHPAFSLYGIVCFSYALFLLWQKHRVAVGVRKLQIRYLLLGILLGGAGVISTNVLVPLIWNTSRYSVLGPYFTLLLVSFSAHAIIRHRLMDIRLVVRRGIVYLIAALFAGFAFACLILLISSGTSSLPSDIPLTLQVLVALGVALSFHPVKQTIQSALDRYLYRQSYDYQRIIRTASRRIGETLELNALLSLLCNTVVNTLKPDLVALFIASPNSDSLTPHTVRTFADPDRVSFPAHLNTQAALATLLTLRDQPFLRDDAARAEHDTLATQAAMELGALGGDIAIPMRRDHELLAILIVGQKLSGDAFFAEDLELLATLTSQTSLALRNAQLYAQVLLINGYIENILRTMDSGVVTVDGSGRIALSNATAEHLVGKAKAELSGRDVTVLPSQLSVPLRATLDDGRARQQVEGRLPIERDRSVPIVYSTSALRESDGQTLGALIVFADVSRLKALESEKRRAERLAAFSTFVSGIAHEIKNPLVAIRTFAELLPDRFAEPDFRVDFSKVVVEEIDRIDDLVSRLRGLAAPLPQSSGPADVRGPILDTLALIRGQLEQAHIVVTRDFQDAQPVVAVEASQLKQLFLNLLLNAIEAIGTHGEITIRVSRRQNVSGVWVVTEISDTGPGIPEPIRMSVFDPFFTTKSRGSGLGLAICRGITDAHQGSIRVEANAVRGTTLVVEFPAALIADSSLTDSLLRT